MEDEDFSPGDEKKKKKKKPAPKKPKKEKVSKFFINATSSGTQKSKNSKDVIEIVDSDPEKARKSATDKQEDAMKDQDDATDNEATTKDKNDKNSNQQQQDPKVVDQQNDTTKANKSDDKKQDEEPITDAQDEDFLQKDFLWQTPKKSFHKRKSPDSQEEKKQHSKKMHILENDEDAIVEEPTPMKKNGKVSDASSSVKNTQHEEDIDDPKPKAQPTKKTPEKATEATYAFPSTIPSVMSKELTYDSVGEDDQVQTFKLSLLMPVSTLCSYCLKLDAVLFPIPNPPKDNFKLGQEGLFCSMCIESVFTNLSTDDDTETILDIKIPHPSSTKPKLLPLRTFTGEDLRRANQSAGGLLFWDLSATGGQAMKRAQKDMQRSKFVSWIADWIKQKKKQIIFYGPPGTGKTFVAQELAEFYTKCKGAKKGSVAVVQFHPTYSYEDFVEGYRPLTLTSKNGDKTASFQLVPGPFKEIAKEAHKNPDSNYILIVDELNRGNVAKIFGELFFLLEYRGKSIRLQYSNKPFSLPPNLYIMATMNTIDRSLARLDRALRRRFFFIPFILDKEPVHNLLEKWLDKNKPEMKYIDKIIKRGNNILKKFDETIAIPYSHFMTPELCEDWFKLVWKYSIVPEVEEVITEEDALKDFVALPITMAPQAAREE